MAISYIALPACEPSEVLQYIIQHQTHPTTLLICDSRSSFLSSLQNDICPASNQSSTTEAIPLEGLSEESPIEPVSHPLLTATLHQISISRHIHTVFTPSISHLRAYLSVFSNSTLKTTSQSTLTASGRIHGKSGSALPKLIVYGLVNLHRESSEWSVQGLGTTLAEVVEAGNRAGTSAIVVEPYHILPDREVEGGAHHGGVQLAGNANNDDTDGDARDTGQGQDVEAFTNSKAREAVWAERVPMLSRSVRRRTETDGDTWMGRTIEIGAILGRWFQFGPDGFWEDHGFAGRGS